ncbi:MAG: carbohydrate ABC transporter permease [Thermotoga sp.]|nr:MAG: carbohydrate ABC transporter permease [Thermotoga sp.]
MSNKGKMYKIAIGGILLLLAVIFIFPFYWMVLTSLAHLQDFMKTPPDLLPRHLELSNYINAIRTIPFFKYFLNTIWITLMSCIGSVLSSSFVAYGFSKIKWPGRDTLFIITLATMMIPFTVTMVPLYIEFKNFGWLGTFKPLWVPFWFGSAWGIFLLRQFYMTIPNTIIDAAKIDGASHIQIWFRIMLPLAKPALSVLFLFQFIWSWQDFLKPLIFLTSNDMYTLTLGLSFFQSTHGGIQWNYLMAAATLTTIPTVIIFLVANRYLIEGIHITSGIKG